MGVWAIGYLAGFTIARPRMEDGSQRSMPSVIARFWTLCAIVYLVVWAVGSLAVGALAAPGGLAIEAVVTMITFPVAAWLFARRKERSTFS